MSDTIRDAFGPLLLALQTEMRGLRAEQAAYQDAMRTFVTTLVNTRATETEGFLQGQFDRLHQRLDQTETSIEQRLTRIEETLKIGRG